MHGGWPATRGSSTLPLLFFTPATKPFFKKRKSSPSKRQPRWPQLPAGTPRRPWNGGQRLRSATVDVSVEPECPMRRLREGLRSIGSTPVDTWERMACLGAVVAGDFWSTGGWNLEKMKKEDEI